MCAYIFIDICIFLLSGFFFLVLKAAFRMAYWTWCVATDPNLNLRKVASRMRTGREHCLQAARNATVS